MSTGLSAPKAEDSNRSSSAEAKKSDSTLMVASIIVAAVVAFAAIEYAGGQSEPRAAFDTPADLPSQAVVRTSLLYLSL